ncbi:hypothetical protein ACRALDRAFT_2055073 [Sodiomyces alcalophilus JCM 7366]|uniref:uncharacterized protein n=1 Tax=Sodiomyces alcalophilus JCM 7366 TaxID=591952 RepID=UPI0039B658C8
MANKFKDEDAEDDEGSSDDGSSFEQVQRPQPRGAAAAAAATAPARSEPAKQPTLPAQATAPPPAQARAPVVSTASTTTDANTPSSSGGARAGSPSNVVESSLEEIKQLLERQTRLISSQSDRIGQLTAEVDGLKRKVGSAAGASQDQSERIRQLELELEAARGDGRRLMRWMFLFSVSFCHFSLQATG